MLKGHVQQGAQRFAFCVLHPIACMMRPASQRNKPLSSDAEECSMLEDSMPNDVCRLEHCISVCTSITLTSFEVKRHCRVDRPAALRTCCKRLAVTGRVHHLPAQYP